MSNSANKNYLSAHIIDLSSIQIGKKANLNYPQINKKINKVIEKPTPKKPKKKISLDFIKIFLLLPRLIVAIFALIFSINEKTWLIIRFLFNYAKKIPIFFREKYHLQKNNRKITKKIIEKKRKLSSIFLIKTFYHWICSWARAFIFGIFIFFIIFATLNFSAYREIFNFWLQNPQTEMQTNLLEKIANTELLSEKKTASTNLNTQKTNHPISKNIIKNTTAKKNLPLPPLEFEITPFDSRLIIPRLGKNLPIINSEVGNLQLKNFAALEKDIQADLKNGVVHYPGTANPGEIGNVFITGHSSYYPWDNGRFKDSFSLLPQLVAGDKFYIYYKEKKYTYRVFDIKEVRPTKVDVLAQPQDKKIATLMTCTPVGTNLRRLIISAEQM